MHQRYCECCRNKSGGLGAIAPRKIWGFIVLVVGDLKLENVTQRALQNAPHLSSHPSRARHPQISKGFERQAGCSQFEVWFFKCGFSEIRDLRCGFFGFLFPPQKFRPCGANQRISMTLCFSPLPPTFSFPPPCFWHLGLTVSKL